MSTALTKVEQTLSIIQSDEMVKAIGSVLPSIVKKERFLGMAIAASKVIQNSKYPVNPVSVAVAVYNAAKLGLELNDALGQCYLVPFRGNCTLIPGYRGLIDLMRRSGVISDIHAFIVCENDDWEYYTDETGVHFKHVPWFVKGEEEGGKKICGVSVAMFTDGSAPSINIMPYSKIEGIKRRVLSRTPSSPWSDNLHSEEMEKKTVIRNHAKRLPVSPEAAKASFLEEKMEIGDLDVTEDLEAPAFLQDKLEAEPEETLVEVKEKKQTPIQELEILKVKFAEKYGKEPFDVFEKEITEKVNPENKKLTAKITKDLVEEYKKALETEE